MNPSPTPVFEILLYSNVMQLKPDVIKFCEDYVNEFAENQDAWFKQDGYRLKTQAVQVMCANLRYIAEVQRNTKLVNFYAAKQQEYLLELQHIGLSKRW